MSVARAVELIGSSPASREAPVRYVVEAASRTVRKIKGVDVRRWTAKAENNRIVEYRAMVKVAFVVERD